MSLGQTSIYKMKSNYYTTRSWPWVKRIPSPNTTTHGIFTNMYHIEIHLKCSYVNRWSVPGLWDFTFRKKTSQASSTETPHLSIGSRALVTASSRKILYLQIHSDFIPYTPWKINMDHKHGGLEDHFPF